MSIEVMTSLHKEDIMKDFFSMHQTCVVTGAASGLGKGLSQKLLEMGCNTILLDVDGEKLKNIEYEFVRKGLNPLIYRLDVTSSHELDVFEKYLDERSIIINYWINCAGISVIKPFYEETEDIWEKTLDVNLKSQFLCSKLAIKHMLKLGKGSIVNFSSQSGKVGTDWYQAYCASKFGVIGLTQSLAKEFGPKNIRINAIAPGVVYTHMWEKQQADYAKKKGIDVSEVMDYFKKKIPLRRIGTIEDVANLVIFLLSDYSSYITGQTININGGDIMF